MSAPNKFRQIEELDMFKETELNCVMKFGKSLQKWDWFAKDTMGKQLVRATDSISAQTWQKAMDATTSKKS